jgi:ubiquinone/menaquinone biosynthesis C-methylase UbiE
VSDGKTQIQHYYDTNADVYDVKHGVASDGNAHNFARYYEPFLAESVPPGSHVLELGCGTGVYTRWLIDRECHVTGMDISDNILQQARRRCPETTFIQGDCEDPASHLPAADVESKFDVVLGINTFSYYPNKAIALKRYRQLLRPHGRVVLLDMNGQCPLYRVMSWMDKNEMRAWYGEVRDSNGPTLTRLASEADLHVRKLTHFAFIPNGVASLTVNLLRPFDLMLSSVPLTRRFAMRVGLVAEGG